MEQTTSPTGTVEFTDDWYAGLLDRVEAAGYDIVRFADGFEAGDVVLRHDVDLSMDAALRVGRLEAERGVRSTYCVLLTSPLYTPLERTCREVIAELESLGHEVALHFSTHEYWDAEPSDEDLRRRVEAERAVLDGLLEGSVETVSFHAPPEWVLDRELAGVTSTYAPAYFGETTYVADSGQRWRESPPDVAAFGDAAQLLTHPGIWGPTDVSFRECVERAVTGACQHATAKAEREFLAGASG